MSATGFDVRVLLSLATVVIFQSLISCFPLV